MVAEFISQNECFTAAEIRGVKELSSGRDSYIDSAIGYVDLCREGNICTVRCEVCPEHKIRAKNYKEEMLVNERDEKIISVSCNDCAASSGGCKHAIAFLMWLQKKSAEPAPTSVESYWRKPALSNISARKFVTMKDFEAEDLLPADDSDVFANEVFDTISKNDSCSEVEIRNFFQKKNNIELLDLPILMLKFKEEGGQIFFTFASTYMTDELCMDACEKSKDQYKSKLWFKLRYGRITASKFYDAAHCNKADGVIVEQILGSYKLRDSAVLERGRKLEKDVLLVVEERMKVKFYESGLILNRNHPVLGASPDGISTEFVLEIKCPSSVKAKGRYITKTGKITAKYNAQIQLQMYLAKKQKEFFV